MKYYTAAALGRVLGLGEDEIKSLTASGAIKEGHVGAAAVSAGRGTRSARADGSGPRGGRDVDLPAEARPRDAREKETDTGAAGRVPREVRTVGGAAAGGGLYVLEDSAREIIAALKKPEERAGSVDYSTERARLVRARREAAEYELGLQEKNLHTSEEVTLAVSKILVGFKAKIRALPSRLAPQCAGMSSQEDISNLLKEATDEALRELSDLDGIFGV